jgi:hypothetical protein
LLACYFCYYDAQNARDDFALARVYFVQIESITAASGQRLATEELIDRGFNPHHDCGIGFDDDGISIGCVRGLVTGLPEIENGLHQQLHTRFPSRERITHS